MKKYLVFYMLDRRFWHLGLKRVLTMKCVAENLDDAVTFADFHLSGFDLWNYRTHLVIPIRPRLKI